jgi:hypothetical protein
MDGIRVPSGRVELWATETVHEARPRRTAFDAPLNASLLRRPALRRPRRFHEPWRQILCLLPGMVVRECASTSGSWVRTLRRTGIAHVPRKCERVARSTLPQSGALIRPRATETNSSSLTFLVAFSLFLTGLLRARRTTVFRLSRHVCASTFSFHWPAPRGWFSAGLFLLVGVLTFAAA